MDDVRSQTDALKGKLDVLQSHIGKPNAELEELKQRMNALATAEQSVAAAGHASAVQDLKVSSAIGHVL
jgi:prefoldin subunit 5